VLKASRSTPDPGNNANLTDVIVLLRLVFDTAALRFRWSATVLKASRSNIKPPTIQGFTGNELWRLFVSNFDG
jgi:hypothetical protein